MRLPLLAVVGLAALPVLVASPVRGDAPPGQSSQPARPAHAHADTWQIPPNAAEEANPIAPDDQVLAKGKDIYQSKCRRCHGPEGKGDGPDADMEHMPEDLSDSSRASRNPDGVMFYKIWNGRRNPKMPAFKTELSKEEVWTLINYVKTLRK